MDEQSYIITFDTVSAAEANYYTEELRQALRCVLLSIAHKSGKCFKWGSRMKCINAHTHVDVLYSSQSAARTWR